MAEVELPSPEEIEEMKVIVAGIGALLSLNGYLLMVRLPFLH